MEKKITQEFLKDLGIYELRELARQVGVESPTTKKRAELCEQILKINSGEITPTNLNQNKGRPPKSVSRIFGIVSEVFPKELLDLKTPKKQSIPSFPNALKFSQFQLADCYSNNDLFIEGYIKTYCRKFYLLNKEVYPFNSSRVVYIPENFVEEFKLREGDKIEGKANPIKDDEECGTLDEIYSINNIEISEYLSQRQNLNTNTICKTEEKINILGEEVNKGSRILLSCQNSLSASEMLVDMIDNDKSQTKYIFVGADLAPEILFFIQSRQKINKFLTGFGQDLKFISQNINNSLKFAETLVKDGNKLVFVIYDVCGLLNSLDMLFANEDCGEYHNHKVKSILLIKQLIGIGRAISEDSFISTISVIFDKDKDKDFIKDEIENLINVKFEK